VLFGSIGVDVPEALCSNVSGRASATEWLRFVLEEDVAEVASLSAFPGSFMLVGVTIAVAAAVLVPIGPAAIAASTTGSWGSAVVGEVEEAEEGVEPMLVELAVVSGRDVCTCDRVVPVVS